MTSEATIQEITRRLVEGFHPVRVILFGSHARGEAGPDSDVDLIVLFDTLGDRYQTEASMIAALRGIPVPIDVLAYTPSEFEDERVLAGGFARPAAEEGRVLYERAA